MKIQFEETKKLIKEIEDLCLIAIAQLDKNIEWEDRRMVINICMEMWKIQNELKNI